MLSRASSTAMGLGTVSASSDSACCADGSGAGVSSIVECLPVVHGGMERNSSNVKTRGLQHFQPGQSGQYKAKFNRETKKAPRHLSGPHGRLVGLDDRCIPLPDL